jgi:hypothetical protein
MALRPILARLFSARLFSVWRTFIVPATVTTVTTVTSMSSVAEQMHPDERREYQHPYPVLR